MVIQYSTAVSPVNDINWGTSAGQDESSNNWSDPNASCEGCISEMSSMEDCSQGASSHIMYAAQSLIESSPESVFIVLATLIHYLNSVCVFCPGLLSLGSVVTAFQRQEILLHSGFNLANVLPILPSWKPWVHCHSWQNHRWSVILTNCPVCSGAWFQRVNDMWILKWNSPRCDYLEDWNSVFSMMFYERHVHLWSSCRAEPYFYLRAKLLVRYLSSASERM